MSISRRWFLGAILATATAPAVVSSGILMPVRKLWVPEPFIAIDEGIIGPEPDLRNVDAWQAWRKLKLNSEYGKFGAPQWTPATGWTRFPLGVVVEPYDREKVRRISAEIEQMAAIRLENVSRNFERLLRDQASSK